MKTHSIRPFNQPNSAIHVRLVPLMIVLLSLAAVHIPLTAQAATVTWTGGAGENDDTWSTGANWSGGSAPGTADIATFGAGTFPTSLNPAGTTLTIAGLAFDSRATGTVTITIPAGTGKLTLNGDAETDISVAAGHHVIRGQNKASGDVTVQGSTHPTPTQVWDVAADASLTFTDVHMRTANAAQNFRKTGDGLVVLAGDSVGSANPWAFGTFYVSGGTLRIAHRNAVGRAANKFEIQAGATFDIALPTQTIATPLVLSGGRVTRSIATGQALTLGTTEAITSKFTGASIATNVKILASTNATSDTTLDYTFTATAPSGAANDDLRASHVFTLSGTGTGTDIYVLQLSVAALETGQSLSWLDNGKWKNAGLGDGVVGSFADSGLAATSGNVGRWGYDLANGATWAILDHGGSFAITSAAIPEAGSAALIIGGVILATSLCLKGAHLWGKRAHF
ncbi:MAG: hypothetical protein LBK99_14085 [Opitutaceae bacterium]|jgi:hypothetical protein|nr:hypothetical protein [Opitutaceae bacterium]